MRTTPRLFLLMIVFIAIPLTCYCQPGGGGNPGGGEPVPITGVEYLLLAGAALGSWKLGIAKRFRK